MVMTDVNGMVKKLCDLRLRKLPSKRYTRFLCQLAATECVFYQEIYLKALRTSTMKIQTSCWLLYEVWKGISGVIELFKQWKDVTVA